MQPQKLENDLRHEVEDVVDSEVEEDKSMIQLQARWDDLMGASSQSTLHQKVIVLILYWNKVDDSSMDVEDETRRLGDVFTNKYNYTVLKQSLNDPKDKEKNAQVALQKHLADAVYEADGNENALLIIYYAGHGNPNTKGQMVLTGSNYDPDTYHPGSEDDAIVWHTTEDLMLNRGRPDMLLIFDCCHAGGLGQDFRGNTFSTRNFEFLGATTKQGRTRIPGPYSFTSALIWALNKLATEEGFTTSQLHATIMKAPDFPTDKQTPVLTEKGQGSLTRLYLAPLFSNEKLAPSEERPGQKLMDPQSFNFGLCLQFTYDRLPSQDDIKRMVDGLRYMERTHAVKAKHINWKGIHRQYQSMYDMSPTFLEAVAKFKGALGRKRSQNNVPLADKSMLAALRNSQHLKHSRAPSVPATQSNGVIEGRISKTRRAQRNNTR